MFIFGLFLVVFGFLAVVVIAGSYTVPQEEQWVIEFLRKYLVTWKAGWHILIPGLMSVRRRVPVYDQSIDLYYGGSAKVDFVDDSAPVRVKLLVRVINPYRVTYEVSDWEQLLRDRVASEIRSAFGQLTFDDALARKAIISQEIQAKVQGYLDAWGLMLNPDGVVVIDIEASPETVAMRRETQRAKRQKGVTITLAEGEGQARVIRATADKDAMVLLGKGEMGRIKAIASGLGLDPQQVIAYLLTGRLYDAMQGSTIIATAEGGQLNIPTIAAGIKAISGAIDKQKGELR